MAESFLVTLVSIVTYQVVGVALFLPFELAFPKERISFKRRADGFIFLLAGAPVMALAGAASVALADALGIHPIPLHFGFGTPLIAAFALAFWLDLQFYVLHRIEHRFFWRFHAVHHSVRDLSAANSYHHWTEAFMALTVAVPLLFFDVKIGPTLGMLTMIFRYWQFYIHSASTPHLGPLRWIFVDNRYHRIHHSLNPAHHDKNFGAVTPLWDWLFGTMYMPKSSEWPDVGLESLAEPQNLKEWATAPWRLGDGERADEAARPRAGRGEVLLDG